MPYAHLQLNSEAVPSSHLLVSSYLQILSTNPFASQFATGKLSAKQFSTCTPLCNRPQCRKVTSSSQLPLPMTQLKPTFSTRVNRSRRWPLIKSGICLPIRTRPVVSKSMYGIPQRTGPLSLLLSLIHVRLLPTIGHHSLG
jgi:hypothetical protein